MGELNTIDPETVRVLREVLHGPIITMRVVNERNIIVWEKKDNASVCSKTLQKWVNDIEWDCTIVRSLITCDPPSMRVICYRQDAITGYLQWTGEEPIYEVVDLVLP